MKNLTKYFIAVISIFIVFSGVSIPVEGQTASDVSKAVEVKKTIKPLIIDFNNIIYTATITTWYNQNGNAFRRGVYLRFYTGNYEEPATWLINAIKLFFNGTEITKKNKPNYFFDSNVGSLASNLNVVVKYKTINQTSNIFSASGTDTPVTMTFPTEGYVYELGKDLRVTEISSSLLNRKDLKVTWTATPDDILVWLYYNGSVIKQLTPAPGKNFVIFNRSLFKPGKDYKIRIFQQEGDLTLGGKYKSGSYIRQHYLIWCNIKTK